MFHLSIFRCQHQQSLRFAPREVNIQFVATSDIDDSSRAFPEREEGVMTVDVISRRRALGRESADEACPKSISPALCCGRRSYY